MSATVPLAVVTGVGFGMDDRSALAGLLGPEIGKAEADVRGRGLRYKDQATKLALRAARAALDDAGVLEEPDLVAEAGLTAPGGTRLAVAGDTMGVIVSSNLGNLETVCRVADTISRQTTAQTSPMDLPNASSNVIASTIALRFGLRGVNLTLCNGPTSGLDAVHWAVIAIAARRVDRIVVVGVETTNPVVQRLVVADGSPESENQLLDGAIALVVESESATRARGALALAGLGGYARRASLVESVATVCPSGHPAVGLWLVPEGHRGGPPPAGLEAAVTRDLSATVARCSGALGVLQCAVGIGWLAGGGSGTVLVTAGGWNADASAALVLTGVGGGS